MKKLLFLFFIWPLITDAHPVSLSWAKAYISEGKILINFTILAEDMILFHDAERDEQYNYETLKLKEIAKEHASLIKEHFFIINGNNNRLPSKVVSVNTNSLDKEKINVMDLMKYKIHYQLVFDLDPAQWEKLVFHQEFTSARSGIPAITFLSVISDGEQLVDKTEVSPGNPFILKPTGNIPEKNPSELTSSYFTITPKGIRHEMTIPGKVYQSMIYQPFLGESLYDQSSAYFRRNNPIFINNHKINPELQFFQTIEFDKDNMPVPEDGFVYFDLFYPAEDGIDSATINWSDYSWDFRWFKSKIYSLDDTYQHTFSRYQPEFFWRFQLKLKPKD